MSNPFRTLWQVGLLVPLLGVGLLAQANPDEPQPEGGGGPGDGENQPPSVAIGSPTEGQVFAAPAEVLFTVEAHHADGGIRSLEFLANGEMIGALHREQLAGAEGNVYRLVWSNVPSGDYVLTAVATDDQGASSKAEPVNIQVKTPLELPVVTLEVKDGLATEQSEFIDSIPDTGLFGVHRTGPVEEPLVVYYRVKGTATNGEDYETLGGEILISAGESSALIPVNPLDDSEVEADETVTLMLIMMEWTPNDFFGSGHYLVGQPEQGTVIIRDDEPRPNDPPTARIVSPPDGALLPQGSDITIIAQGFDRDGWVAGVEFFVDGVSIGKVEGGPIPPEPRPMAEQLLRNDWLPAHLFQIVWKDPTPGEHQLIAIATDNAGEEGESDPVQVIVMEILERAVVTVTATDPSATEGAVGSSEDALDANVDPAVFTVERTGDVDFELEVYFNLEGTAGNGEDYQELPTSVVIPEGERTVKVIILPIEDDLVERTETVVLTLVPPVCPEIFPAPRECYLVGQPNRARAVILDNDEVDNHPPRVRLVAPQDGEVFLASQDVMLSAAAWDRDGNIRGVEFFAGERSLGIVTIPDPIPLTPEMPDGGLPPTDLSVPRYSLIWSDAPAGTYTLTAVATDNDGASSQSGAVRVKVLSLQVPPVVNVEAVDPEAAEPEIQRPVSDDGTRPPILLDTATFAISRTGPTDQALTVHYRLGGVAKNGVDYEKVPYQVTIPSGSEAVRVIIAPLHDELPEGDEDVVLQLVPTLCVPNDVVASGLCRYVIGIGPRAAAKAVIHDNDDPVNIPPRIAIVRPVDGQVFVNTHTVKIKAIAADPNGWVPRVEFYADGEMIGEIEILPIREPDPGTPMTFEFTWEDVPMGRHELVARAVDDQGATTDSSPVRIAVQVSQELPVITIRATDPVASESGLLTVIDPAVFTVHRTGSIDEALMVHYAVGGSAENGVDYLELPGTVEIPSGARTVEVEVIPISDDLEEGVERVVLELEPVRCPIDLPMPPSGCYMVGEPARAVAVIRDAGPLNGSPRLEIVQPRTGTVFQEPADVLIVAQAQDRDGRVALVEFFANDEKIGDVSINFLVEPPPGEMQTFSFNWADIPVGDYALTAQATDNEGQTSAMSEAVLIGVLPSAETPVVSLWVTDPIAFERPWGNGQINTATFKIRRSGSTENEMAVFYEINGTAENGQDYVTISSHTVIPSGSRWARITITPIDDDWVEGKETIHLSLVESPAASPLPTYRIGRPNRGVAIIVDDDREDGDGTERPEGMFHARLRAEDGKAYRMEASDDLIHWVPVADRESESGEVHHIDPDSADKPHRFYRLHEIVREAFEDE